MNKFTNKTIEQLADQSINDENCINIDIEPTYLNISESDIADLYGLPVDSFGVQVDAYSDLKPSEDDFVMVSLWFKCAKTFKQPFLDLSIEDAEKLGKLLIFQSKVARLAQKKKRQIMNLQAAQRAAFFNGWNK